MRSCSSCSGWPSQASWQAFRLSLERRPHPCSRCRARAAAAVALCVSALISGVAAGSTCKARHKALSRLAGAGVKLMATHDGHDVHASAQPAVHTPIDSDASSIQATHPPVRQQGGSLASRVSALGLGRTQAAERRSTAHADRWCRMELVHALDIRTACRSRLQPQGRWGRSNAKLSRGQSCMSLSSYSECNGHDPVLPDQPRLPAADSAHKSRLCCAECDGPVHG